MENDVVFANEMDQFHVVSFPILFPVFIVVQRPLFGGGDVANWRIKPNVEHFAFAFGQWNGDAPVQITGDRPCVQAAFQPGQTLSQNVVFPGFGVVVLLAVQDSGFNPGFEPLSVIVQFEVPVFGFFQYRRFATEGRTRIDQFQGRQVRATVFTLVAVGFGVSTLGAGTDDVAIGQKLIEIFVVVLLDKMFFEFVAFFVQVQEKIL